MEEEITKCKQDCEASNESIESDPIDLFRCTQSSIFNEVNPDRVWQKELQSWNYQLTHIDTDHYKLFTPSIAKKLAEDTCRLLV